jgi:hypothetical protein
VLANYGFAAVFAIQKLAGLRHLARIKAEGKTLRLTKKWVL